jgi:hypothetical protein
MDDAQKAKLKISPQAAAFLRKEIPREEKLKAARGEIPLEPSDLIALLLYLSRDKDTELSKLSFTSLKGLQECALTEVCTRPDTHPVILDVLARLHYENTIVAEQITIHRNTGDSTLAFLAKHELVKARQIRGDLNNADTEISDSGSDEKPAVNTVTSESDQEEDEKEESKSKFQISQSLGIKDKIKLAFTGDKEWRMLLVRDNNKMVSEAVIKNPRITEQEVLLICKSTVKNDDIIRTICANKDWTKNSQIRKALIENPKTPLHYALAFLSYLGEKDLAFLAKSKNISSVIATQARRMLFNKKYGK